MHEIVEAARSLIGTPFQHQQRMAGVAIDCVGVLIVVARQFGYVPPDFDFAGYSRIPDGRSFKAELDKYMVQVDRADMRPGDAVLVAIRKDPQHVGILGDYRHGGLSIIHAASDHGRVLETRLMFTPVMKFVAAYRFPEVAPWRA